MSKTVLQVNARSGLPATELAEEFLGAATPISAVPGLEWKIFAMNEERSEAAGIYLFADEKSLQAYLEGPIMVAMEEKPAFSDISVKIFEVVDEPTRVTRGPVSSQATDGDEGTLLESNKQAVLEFYDLIINKKDFDAARPYLGTSYRQHNPLVGDGPEGLAAFVEFLRTEHPQAHSVVKRVFAEGDHVILHVHSMRPPHPRGRAIIEIFRLEEGKIVEHWDTIQEIPETSANPSGMF